MISFSSDLYGDVVLESELPHLQKNISIVGVAGRGQDVVRDIRASTQFEIFSIDSGKSCTIGQLLIGGGTDSGIQNNGTLTLGNCTISGNSADSSFGGGIRNSSSGSLTLNYCTVELNTAYGGGGGIENLGGYVYCTGTTISQNQATTGSGGGIDNSLGGTVYLYSDCTIMYNTASDSGGGISSEGSGSTVVMYGGTLSNNSATKNGGGLYCGINSTGAYFSGTTISNNAATDTTLGQGGGFCLDYGSVAFEDCTITGNTAHSGNGGAYSSTNAGYSTSGCTIGPSDNIVSY